MEKGPNTNSGLTGGPNTLNLLNNNFTTLSLTTCYLERQLAGNTLRQGFPNLVLLLTSNSGIFQTMLNYVD